MSVCVLMWAWMYIYVCAGVQVWAGYAHTCEVRSQPLLRGHAPSFVRQALLPDLALTS